MDIKTLSSQEAYDLLKKNEAIIFDVRSSIEYQAETIPFAKSLPLNEISPKKVATFIKGDEKVIFHCGGGGRSKKACEKIYETTSSIKPYSLEGGLRGWKKLGFPTANKS